MAFRGGAEARTRPERVAEASRAETPIRSVGWPVGARHEVEDPWRYRGRSLARTRNHRPIPTRARGRPGAGRPRAVPRSGGAEWIERGAPYICSSVLPLVS